MRLFDSPFMPPPAGFAPFPFMFLIFNTRFAFPSAGRGFDYEDDGSEFDRFSSCTAIGFAGTLPPTGDALCESFRSCFPSSRRNRKNRFFSLPRRGSFFCGGEASAFNFCPFCAFRGSTRRCTITLLFTSLAAASPSSPCTGVWLGELLRRGPGPFCRTLTLSGLMLRILPRLICSF